MKSFFKRKIVWLVSVLGVFIVVWAFFWPLPKYIESPGSADNLGTMVKIKHHPDQQKGEFMITSVRIAQANPISYLLASILPYQDIEDEQSVTNGQSSESYMRIQSFYMTSAINEAKVIAAKASGDKYNKKYLGIYVMDIQKQSKFNNRLKVGDTITKVDGHHFKNSFGFQRYIQSKKVGEKLQVNYQRGPKHGQVTAPLIEISAIKKPGIGITLTDNIKVTTQPEISVNAGQIGGPSGGLMLSLQIYSQLTGENIQHGRKIAGTGTINPDGSVGEIGGIDKKIVAANKAGATIFFTPYVKPTKALLTLEEGHKTNYQLAKITAEKVAPKMRVVPVKSFEDALQYLKNH